MAATREHAWNAQKPWLYSAEKENRPPPSSKRKYSFGVLFDDVRKKRWKHAGGEQACPTAPQLGAEFEDLFGQFKSNMGKGASVAFEDFDQITDAYMQDVHASMNAQLQPVCDELAARVKGLDLHGRLVPRPAVPTDADLEALEADQKALTRPLGDEELDVEIPHADGSKTLKRLTLGSVVEAYNKLSARKDAELRQLELELEAINIDLAAGYEDLNNENDEDLVRARRQFDAEKQKFKRGIQASKDQLQTDFAYAAAEDKAAKASFNKKLQNLVKGLEE
ncbi:hypothetical protein LTR53_009042 [Teratosphaeriaceae sp. CCFEE 6253]|nr:hypothetical protein LTR53_009042 [Teratosphaeriaceae sp. CCFEE 6253]